MTPDWKRIGPGTVSRSALATGLPVAVTGVLFLSPEYYQYAPLVGGIVAGTIGRNAMDGARSGVRIGAVMIPLGIVLSGVSALSDTFRTGVDVLTSSLNIGPQGILFYAVLVFVLSVYTGLAAGTVGGVTGAVAGAVRRGDIGAAIGPSGRDSGTRSGSDPLVVPRDAEDISIRRIRIRSVVLAIASVTLVVTYWWFQDFRLRLIGDAGAAMDKCGLLVSDPLSWFTSAQLLYSGFQIPFCGVLGVAGVRAWFGLQMLGWALAVVLIYRAGAQLFGERAGLIAGIATLLTWESFRFAVRAQSDLALLLMVAVGFWSLARYERTPTRKRLAVVVVVLSLVMVTRPLGFPLVFGWAVWELLAASRGSWLDIRNPSSTGLLFYVGVAVLSLFVVQSFFLPRLNFMYTDPSIHWRTGGFISSSASGVVATHPRTPTFRYLYQPRPATNLAVWLLVNADHLAILGLFRASFFFVPVLPRWSTFHVVTNAITIAPLVLGAFAGTRRLLAERRYNLVGLLLAPVVGNLVTVGILYVDGGFNYRAPSTLAFALLTGYWLGRVVDERRTDDWVRERLSSISPT